MAYNEAGSLRSVVEEIGRELQGLSRPCEIIIVNDGSTDGSAQAAEELARANPSVSVIHHPANRGLGGVYATGFAKARGDYITFFPADGQFPASIIKRFLCRMDDADLILGYIPERKSPVLGILLSACEKLLYRCLFGPVPRLQGIFMVRRSILRELNLQSDPARGWGIVMELIIRAHRARMRIAHESTTMRPRSCGSSKVNNIRTAAANFKQLLRLFFILRRR